MTPSILETRLRPIRPLTVSFKLFWFLNFLSKVEHEASFGLPSLYLRKSLVHLFKLTYFRDHLGFSRRVKLKRLSQINSIS